MSSKISKTQRFIMMNPVIQFVRFIILSLKVLIIVAGGHGGTRNK
ncbi:MAG: hypothetical protein NWS53_01885 [Salibacteraceae bacterium]|nr:hypothetical protein [Salibacteraceae bacterium]